MEIIKGFSKTGINILDLKPESCETLKGTYLKEFGACVFILVNPEDYKRYPDYIDTTKIAKEAFNKYKYGEIDRENTLKFFKELERDFPREKK